MTTILDRKQPIAFKTVDKLELVKASEQHLANGVPVYSVNTGTQEIVKIEFLFNAGMFSQIRPLQAITTNAMLECGTQTLNADEIADKVDYYGAFLETHIAQDSASVVLYTLNKHLNNILPIVEDVIKNSTFPKDEIKTYLGNKKQIFLVNNQKVVNVARKRFMELLFGEKHPYGINLKENYFDEIESNHLLAFYNRFYTSENCSIIVSGRIDDDVMLLLDKHFGDEAWKKSSIIKDDSLYGKNSAIAVNTSDIRVHELPMNGSLQSAIRIGKMLFNKTHEDYQSFQVLNTILGGYFGSRLMNNIREDKGYTYGIGSSVASLKHGGYFFITTEVGVDVCKSAIHEIYSEINRLKEERVGDKELQLVKNFMLGSFLRSADGPFAMAERFKGLLLYNLDYNFYDSYVATIKNITASKIQELANQYLNKESMIEVVAGKR